MSSYHAIEFRAIDRPLGDAALVALRQLSTRAEISSTRFRVVYHYGSFGPDPDQVLLQHFDVLVEVASWGLHRVALRLPADALDDATLAPYLWTSGLHSHRSGRYRLLAFERRADSDGGWIEDADHADPLVPLRHLLLAGDQRPLYIAWLAGLGALDDDTEDLEDAARFADDALEPPVPPGLAALTPALTELAAVLRVDGTLVRAAAQANIGSATLDDDAMARVVRELPAGEKDALLLRVAGGDGSSVASELTRRARAAAPPATAAVRRTVGQLRAAWRQEHARQVAEEARMLARAQALRASELAAERERRLNFAATTWELSWRKVDEWIATSQPAGYERAVERLGDLRDVAPRLGRDEEFATRMAALVATFAKRRGLMKRFADAGLVAG